MDSARGTAEKSVLLPSHRSGIQSVDANLPTLATYCGLGMPVVGSQAFPLAALRPRDLGRKIFPWLRNFSLPTSYAGFCRCMVPTYARGQGGMIFGVLPVSRRPCQVVNFAPPLRSAPRFSAIIGFGAPASSEVQPGHQHRSGPSPLH